MYEWIADTVSKTFAAGRLNELEGKGWEVFSTQWIKEKDGQDLTLCYTARRSREQSAGEQEGDQTAASGSEDYKGYVGKREPRWPR
ncbi:hypothetical protein [Sorangium sp. So ce131]|uniref:hypothetical protein n=1 Tax=Sorangium sp. So ce131 TaxID=3133282 RepID=UPI003F610E77